MSTFRPTILLETTIGNQRAFILRDESIPAITLPTRNSTTTDSHGLYITIDSTTIRLRQSPPLIFGSCFRVFINSDNYTNILPKFESYPKRLRRRIVTLLTTVFENLSVNGRYPALLSQSAQLTALSLLTEIKTCLEDMIDEQKHVTVTGRLFWNHLYLDPKLPELITQIHMGRAPSCLTSKIAAALQETWELFDQGFQNRCYDCTGKLRQWRDAYPPSPPSLDSDLPPEAVAIWSHFSQTTADALTRHWRQLRDLKTNEIALPFEGSYFAERLNTAASLMQSVFNGLYIESFRHQISFSQTDVATHTALAERNISIFIDLLLLLGKSSQDINNPFFQSFWNGLQPHVKTMFPNYVLMAKRFLRLASN